MTDPAVIRCRDACGRWFQTEEMAEAAGWTRLSISGGYRCGVCAAALVAARGIVGPAGQTEDTLPPHSRGALPKETVSTITPPSKGVG